MELRMKKRIVGVTLLIAMGLIIIPMFFGRSVSTDELKLSGHVPHPPALPAGLTASIPSRDATMPAVAKQSGAPAANNATMAGGIVFEQLESLPFDTTKAAQIDTTTKAAHTEAATTTAATPVQAQAQAIKQQQGTPIKEDNSATAPTASTRTTAVTPGAPATAIFANPEQGAVLPEVAIVPPVLEKEAKPVVKTPKAKPVHTAAIAQKDANTAANPQSWAVQLGSFSDRINASNLMKKLQDAGFSAYMHESKSGQGNLIRVLVGPQLHRSDANKIQKQLQQQFSLKSIIVKVNS